MAKLKKNEAILEDFQSTNISVACLRYFNPVGSHNTLELGDNINEETDGLVSNLLTSIIENKKFIIYIEMIIQLRMEQQ